MSIATEGGSRSPVPDLPSEVNDVDDVYRRAKAPDLDMVYELTNEPWGVPRFYIRDPAGKLLHVLAHRQA